MPERAVLFLAIAQTLIWASASYIFAAMLLWWEDDLGWSREVLTGAFTTALLVSAVSSPFAGRLIDKGHGHVMMGIATACAGGLVAALAWVQEIWQFYAIWIAIGVMISGCLYEPCFALITRARGPEGRSDIVAITLVAGFASTISFPLANFLSEAYGWRVAAQVFGCMSVLIAAPLMYLGAREIEASRSMSLTEKSDANGYSRAFMKQPEFWFLGLAFACGALLQQITINHLLAIMADRNVVRDISILAASFIGPMQVAGRIAIVVAGSRASNHLVAIFSFLAMGASIVMLSMAQSGFGFIVAFTVLFGAAHGVVSVIRPGLTWDILGGENIGAKMGFLAGRCRTTCRLTNLESRRL